MLKKNKNVFFIVSLLFVLIVYLLISNVLGIYVPCLFHEITGFFCPGCGITRMLHSILVLDFYQAFRYNQLVFVSLPVGLYLYVDNAIKIKNNRKSIIQLIPRNLWIVIVIIFIIFGVIRNIPYFSFFKPTIV